MAENQGVKSLKTRGNTLKTIVNILAVLMAFVGVVFFLQGINILPGSFMTGDPTWAVIGAVMVLIAAGWFIYNSRRNI